MWHIKALLPTDLQGGETYLMDFGTVKGAGGVAVPDFFWSNRFEDRHIFQGVDDANQVAAIAHAEIKPATTISVESEGCGTILGTIVTEIGAYYLERMMEAGQIDRAIASTVFGWKIVDFEEGKGFDVESESVLNRNLCIRLKPLGHEIRIPLHWEGGNDPLHVIFAPARNAPFLVVNATESVWWANGETLVSEEYQIFFDQVAQGILKICEKYERSLKVIDTIFLIAAESTS